MVRLKGERDTPKICLIRISIPYGSIKSRYIPCVQEVLKLFQFLMVRLKDSGHTQQGERKTFQFLMVRLKVSIRSVAQSEFIFQFLMVRLKV